MRSMTQPSAAIATAGLLLLCAAPARAELSAEELAKLAQNPVGNLISVPFQNNTNLNYGPEKGTQNILNIQPVIPIEVDKDWNIITRTIVPLIWMPALGTGHSGEERHRRHPVFGVPVAGQPGALDLGRSARLRSCRPTAAKSSATRTGDSARRPWCCTSTTATRGSTAC